MRPKRPTSPEERALIVWLLADVPESLRQRYLDQITALCVTYHCECGCPTVEFGTRVRPFAPVILAEAYGAAPEGVELDVILWQSQGELSGLEFVAHADESRFTPPMPDVLTRLPVQRTAWQALKPPGAEN